MRTCLALVSMLPRLCAGTQLVPTPPVAFPSEALGFRFGASYEEA